MFINTIPIDHYQCKLISSCIHIYKYVISFLDFSDKILSFTKPKLTIGGYCMRGGRYQQTSFLDGAETPT